MICEARRGGGSVLRRSVRVGWASGGVQWRLGSSLAESTSLVVAVSGSMTVARREEVGEERGDDGKELAVVQAMVLCREEGIALLQQASSRVEPWCRERASDSHLSTSYTTLLAL